MKKKLWLMQLPIMGFFCLCFRITDLGYQGQLAKPFLREKVFPILSRATNTLTDFKFTVRGPKAPKNKVIVLEIDNATIEHLGRWPWHRDLMSFVIDKTFAAGAKVVGLDMVFSEKDQRIPDDLYQVLQSKGLGKLRDEFETDRVMTALIRSRAPGLVMGWASDAVCQPLFEEKQYCPVMDPNALSLFPPYFEKFSISHFKTPKPFDPEKAPMLSFVTPLTNLDEYGQAAKHLGYFFAQPDVDGYIRRTSLFTMAKGKPYPSLALKMASVGLKEELQLSLDETQRVESLGFIPSEKKIPVSPLGVLQINFRGPSSVFDHVSVEDIISDQETIQDQNNPKLLGHSKKEVFQDAYVIIGVTALGVFDMRQFPFESNAAGVYGHANILENVLSGDPLTPGPLGLRLLIFFLMLGGVVAFAYSIEKLEAVPALILCIAAISVLGIWDFKFMFGRNYNLNTAFLYMEVATVFVLTLAAKYVMEERNKKFIRGAFSKYVAPTVVDSILKDPGKLSLGGEKRELTILFSDIRGFTTFSEKMDAKALAAFLNDYLGIMTKLVFDNQGTLDKYIGDAVMAFWGAPLDQALHALNACKAAIAMMQALEQNRSRFQSQYGIEVNIGIGINSGLVNVGNMGSENNFEYTVIGDHVNLASRTEGLTKKYGVTILATRFTLECIEKAGQKVPAYRSLDDVKVKGKKNAVELVQILEKDYSAEGLKLFGEGRELYKAQKWSQAREKFQAANQLLAPGSSDGPCQIFLERCNDFEKEAPPSDWDGSWEMDSK